MREIGGYIELDKYKLPMLHDDGIALNCGRNALAYVIRGRNIKRLWIPRLICDSVIDICDREGVSYYFYNIGIDFLPSQELNLEENDWLYFVNYYSQFNNEKIQTIIHNYHRVIVDQAQSYFQSPIPNVDTIYTCRKYFGVADGAVLYSDIRLEGIIDYDVSYNRMSFLLGRYEKNASDFYKEYVDNNEMFSNEPIKFMSKLTNNLLHGIDYSQVERIRSENCEYLHQQLIDINQLNIKKSSFMYPLMIDNGFEIRRKLIDERIYIPILWPYVFKITNPDDIEYKMAESILPLPIDQRYGIDDMAYIVDKIKSYLND